MISLLRNRFLRSTPPCSPHFSSAITQFRLGCTYPIFYFSEDISNNEKKKKKKERVHLTHDMVDGINYVQDSLGKVFKVPDKFNLYPRKFLSPAARIPLQYLGVDVDVLNRNKDLRKHYNLEKLAEELNEFSGRKRFLVHGQVGYIYCIECATSRKGHHGFRVELLKNKYETPVLFVQHRAHFKSGHNTDFDTNYVEKTISKEEQDKLDQWMSQKDERDRKRELERQAKASQKKLQASNQQQESEKKDNQ